MTKLIAKQVWLGRTVIEGVVVGNIALIGYQAPVLEVVKRSAAEQTKSVACSGSSAARLSCLRQLPRSLADHLRITEMSRRSSKQPTQLLCTHPCSPRNRLKICRASPTASSAAGALTYHGVFASTFGIGEEGSTLCSSRPCSPRPPRACGLWGPRAARSDEDAGWRGPR